MGCFRSFPEPTPFLREGRSTQMLLYHRYEVSDGYDWSSCGPAPATDTVLESDAVAYRGPKNASSCAAALESAKQILASVHLDAEPGELVLFTARSSLWLIAPNAALAAPLVREMRKAGILPDAPAVNQSTPPVVKARSAQQFPPPTPATATCVAGHCFDSAVHKECPQCAPAPRKRPGILLSALLLLAAVAILAVGFLFWPRVRPAPPAPAISSFWAEPASIAQGEKALLRWSAVNATLLEIDHGVGEVTGQEIEVQPAVTTTYTLKASGGGKEVTLSALVAVIPHREIQPAAVAPPPMAKKLEPTRPAPERLIGSPPPLKLAPPSIEAFSVDPPRVDPGHRAVLRWSVKNADTVTLNPGIGPVTGNSLVIFPYLTTTYTLNASRMGITDTRPVQIVVNEPLSNPTPSVEIARPTSGIRRCPGMAVLPGKTVVFKSLPGPWLHLDVDPKANWAPTLSPQPDGTVDLILTSKLSEPQSYCTVRWTIVP